MHNNSVNIKDLQLCKVREVCNNWDNKVPGYTLIILIIIAKNQKGMNMLIN